MQTFVPILKGDGVALHEDSSGIEMVFWWKDMHDLKSGLKERVDLMPKWVEVGLDFVGLVDV